MKERQMTDWRLLQVVLDDNGVHEVEYDFDSAKHLRCSCSRWGTCKHRKYVHQQMKKSGGRFEVRVPDSFTPEQVAEATNDAESYRQLVLRYGTVGAVE